MRQFVEQVRQVAIVYFAQIRSWVWILAALVFAFSLWALTGANSHGSRIIPIAVFYAQFFGAWIVDQVKHQFAHSRARLLPKFNAAHLIVPTAFIFLTSAVLPSVIAMMSRVDPLPYAAITSILMALSLLARVFPRLLWLIASILIFAMWQSRDSDLEFVVAIAELRPSRTIPIFCLGWLGIAFYFFKLCHLAEDDAVYRQLNDETATIAAAGDEAETRAKYRNAARWWAISDRWHAKIGGFHQFHPLRIIRLLRYGFGAVPVELIAFALALVITLFVSRIVPPTDDSYDLTRSTDFVFLIVPPLFASMAPIAVAGGAIGLRVPRLKNEILFPLTRRELIDDLLLASAWHSLLIWFLGCASGMAILLYALPAESKTVSLFATAALLTGATAIFAFGLSLHIVMFEVKAAQFFVLGLFVLAFIFLTCSWWLSREKSGDGGYWIVALLIGGVGILMTRTGRTAWLNQEFGR